MANISVQGLFGILVVRYFISIAYSCKTIKTHCKSDAKNWCVSTTKASFVSKRSYDSKGIPENTLELFLWFFFFRFVIHPYPKQYATSFHLESRQLPYPYIFLVFFLWSDEIAWMEPCYWYLHLNQWSRVQSTLGRLPLNTLFMAVWWYCLWPPSHLQCFPVCLCTAQAQLSACYIIFIDNLLP